MRKKQQKGFLWPPLLFIGLLLFASYVLSTTLELKSPTDSAESYRIQQEKNFSKQESVQLGTVDLVQNTPTPVPTITTDACSHDMSKKADPDKCDCIAYLFKCEANKCVDANPDKSNPKGTPKEEICRMANDASWCTIFGRDGDGWYCVGKPVIYLYPEKPLLVDVKVATEGEIFVSDPHIEYYIGKSFGGWKNVFAQPDGTLIYQEKKYRELFYESLTKTVKRPERGIIISKENLEKDLLSFITRLGLTRSDEQKEFLDWWMPLLEKLPTDKIFVSILEKDEKTRIDKVNISPKPDTFIEFIMYFAPLSSTETVDPLVLPPTPKRIGFTAIEWGGVIAR